MTSIDRVRFGYHHAGGLLGSFVACAMLVAPVQAQESSGDAWFAWFGCWEAVGQPAGAPEANDVCIAPSEGPVGVDLLTVSDNQVTAHVRSSPMARSTTSSSPAVAAGNVRGGRRIASACTCGPSSTAKAARGA